jgi:hypothetical protein
MISVCTHCHFFVAAACAAPLIEGWDFEEEEPLDQRQYRFGSSHRAGRLR